MPRQWLHRKIGDVLGMDAAMVVLLKAIRLMASTVSAMTRQIKPISEG
jgi:hypothetical protein